MKIIRITCCKDCPYSFYVPFTGIIESKCKEQNKKIPAKTFENDKIWNKCRLEDKK